MLMLIALLLLAAQGYSKALPQFLCKECVEATQEAQDFLSNPSNLDSLIIYAKSYGCANIPGVYQDKCNDMAEEYISMAFTSLREYVTPQHICLDTGVCEAADQVNKIKVVKKNNCPLCRYLVLEMKVKLQDPKTQEKLIEFLLENCQKLGKRENECKLLVLEYGPQVLANMEVWLNDDEICARIGMCPSKSLLRDTM